MKFEYDKSADAAYVYVKYPVADGQVVKTVQLNEHVAIDYDAQGKIVGIEILSASAVLDADILA